MGIEDQAVTNSPWLSGSSVRKDVQVRVLSRAPIDFQGFTETKVDRNSERDFQQCPSSVHFCGRIYFRARRGTGLSKWGNPVISPSVVDVLPDDAVDALPVEDVEVVMILNAGLLGGAFDCPMTHVQHFRHLCADGFKSPIGDLISSLFLSPPCLMFAHFAATKAR